MILLNEKNKLAWLKLSVSLKHQKKVMQRSHISVHIKIPFSDKLWICCISIFTCTEENSGGPVVKRYQFVALAREYIFYLFIELHPGTNFSFRGRTGCLIWGKATGGMSCSCRCKCLGWRCKCAALTSVVEDGINPLPPPPPPLLGLCAGGHLPQTRHRQEIPACFSPALRQNQGKPFQLFEGRFVLKTWILCWSGWH